MLGWLLGRDEDVDEDEEEEFDPDAELDDLLDEDAPHPVSLDCDCFTCEERWRVAVHEAGHVAAFHALGEPFEYVTIHPNPDADEVEHAEGASGGGMVHMTQDTDDMHSAQDLGNYLIIYSAGGVAEQMVRGEVLGMAHDEEGIEEFLQRPACPFDADEAWALAEEVISENYDAMIGIAKDLFEQGTLSYTETV